MHLIWENLVKNLILLWTGEFKGMDEGSEDYELTKAIWEAIAASTASASDTIPSAFGSRVPNISKDRPNVSAEMWSFWTFYLGPVLLRRRFKNVKYYCHFIQLVRLLNLCIQFEITLTKHAPVPVPMLNYWEPCLQPGIRSRRFPWASIDRYVTEVAQLTQIKTRYNVAQELSLTAPRGAVAGSLQDPSYPTCILIPPKSPARPDARHIKPIAAAMSTRLNIPVGRVITALQEATIEEWGKVQRIDSEAGDTMRSCSLGVVAEDSRDATYVRYEMLFELQTFYGQLTHIYHIHFPESCPELRIDAQTTYILAAIRSCTLKDDEKLLEKLDIHFYSRTGALDVIDITSVQSLIGRVKATKDEWGIIDRSGALARAQWLGEEDL
ncbi:hypothetical protein C8F04DRAFT_1215111 [Mycena alexandri]|uniref:Uncharacterized protein n=1 Tax=Mycena alexandri TaxID=1745969 RepID=A0AAD6WLX5_9AGAR|nr:hypothetical protein C8F04DRAFT_1215111 [Mycena alexandri]